MSAGDKDQAYWNERSVILNESLLDIGDEFYDKLVREYDRAIGRIEKEIDAFYSRFAKDNKVTFSEAKRLLTSEERKRFTLELDEYIERGKSFPYSTEWAMRLENASTAHRVTRLEYLKLQMGQQVEELYTKYNIGMTKTAERVFTEGYYRNIFDAQKAKGQSFPFATLDTEKVKTVIAKPWAPDGSNFSEKIWKDRQGLVNYLHKELAQAFIRGETPDRLIKDIKKKFAVYDPNDPKSKIAASKNAARLVQTEMAFFSAMSKLESYKALGYKKYIIVAVMDAKTSAICRDMDGEVFDIEDFQPGATANPFHPRCRTTTAPYIVKGTDAAGPGMVHNPKTGEMETIPKDMSYKEWYEKFVDSSYHPERKPVFFEKDSKSLGSGDKPGAHPESKPVFVEKITPDMIDKKLIGYENSIKDNDFETAYVVTETGDTFRIKGGKNNVVIRDIPLKGAIVTHNHPPDEWGVTDSFGQDDFNFLQAHPNIKELRAVSQYYRYKLRPLKPIDISYTIARNKGLELALSQGVDIDREWQHYVMEYLK